MLIISHNCFIIFQKYESLSNAHSAKIKKEVYNLLDFDLDMTLKLGHFDLDLNQVSVECKHVQAKLVYNLLSSP